LVAFIGGASVVSQPAWAQLLPLPLPPLFPPEEPPPPEPEPEPEPPPPEPEPPPPEPEPPPPEPEPPPPEPEPPAPEPEPAPSPPEAPPPAPPPQSPPPAPSPGEPPASAPATTTRAEEHDPDVIVTGNWARRGPEIAIFSDGAALSSDAGGATLSVLFRGTKVSWLSVKCTICGIATVSIDGGAATTVDTAGSAAPGTPGLMSEVVFTAENLTDDVHALRITVTGNSSASGGHVVVDAFDVTDGTATATASDEEGGGGATDVLWLSLLSLLSLFAVALRTRGRARPR
jgi:hypothetical protein